METFDDIVIGAGSAGCVLANRLTGDGRHSVRVQEAGPPDWHPLIHIPCCFNNLLDDRFVNWRYHTEPSEWTPTSTASACHAWVKSGSNVRHSMSI